MKLRFDFLTQKQLAFHLLLSSITCSGSGIFLHFKSLFLFSFLVSLIIFLKDCLGEEIIGNLTIEETLCLSLWKIHLFSYLFIKCYKERTQIYLFKCILTNLMKTYLIFKKLNRKYS